MKSILLGILVFVTFQVPSFARGGMDSGGGAAYAANFIELGYQAVKMVRMQPSLPVSAAEFQRAVENTKVEITEDKLIDSNGVEVDALNYPDRKLIRVNSNRYALLIVSPSAKFQLVIHEYLGILRMDDSTYQLSRQILAGGVKINSLVCKFSADGGEGTLGYYQVDFDADGEADDTKAASLFKVEDSEIVVETTPVFGLGMRGDEMGQAVSWAPFIRMFNVFLSNEKLGQSGSFEEPYFALTKFNTDGTPIYEKAGYLNCNMQVN